MAIISQPGKSVNGLRLGIFIAISIVVHSLLLAGWLQTTPSYPTASSLSVTVVNQPQDKKQETETRNEPVRKKEMVQDSSDKVPGKPAPVPDTNKPVRSDTKKTVIKEETAIAQTATQSTSVAITHDRSVEKSVKTPASFEPTEKASFSLAEAREQIREQLNQDLARHFHYPRLAWRRGWEGTVLLDLLIETDGKISHISIAQSSGYSLFDNSAIEAINKVGNVRDAARWLQGRSLEMQLPVIYRLTDS